MERRLAAILAADVVGYGRLMAADEGGTLEALKAHRKDLIEPRITEHRGHTVKLTGDGLLVEFSSVVEAMQCAVEVQQGMVERNQAISEDRQIWFRIGINLGDVIVESGDIHGDGVNIAARLEELAEAGGICVSRNVRNLVRDKLPLAFEDLGTHTLKNIPRPVQVFRTVISNTAKPAVALGKPRRRASLRLASAAAGLGLVFAGGLVWWFEPRVAQEATETAGRFGRFVATADDPVLAMPTGPAVAVLPFDDLAGDPDQGFFADGLTEEIITRLARSTNLRVIPRHSTFRYQDRPVDVRRIREELGARYIVQGSIRRSAAALLINVQLIDAVDGEHVWAQTYNRDPSATAVFEVQDRINDRIVAAIASNWGEVARQHLKEVRATPPRSLASYECVLLGHAYDRVIDEPSHLAALECLEWTVEQEPDYAEAWARLAFLYNEQVWSKFNLRADKDPGALALAAARRALQIDPNNARAQAVLAFAHFWRRDRESYVEAAERALELNPNDTSVLAEIALRMKGIGLCDRSFALAKKAVALSPYPLPRHYMPLVNYYYDGRKYRQALATVEEYGTPHNYWTHAKQAAIYGQLEEHEKAKQAVLRLLQLNPDFPSAARREIELWNWGYPDYVEHFLEGLRKAGLDISPAS